MDERSEASTSYLPANANYLLLQAIHVCAVVYAHHNHVCVSSHNYNPFVVQMLYWVCNVANILVSASSCFSQDSSGSSTWQSADNRTVRPESCSSTGLLYSVDFEWSLSIQVWQEYRVACTPSSCWGRFSFFFLVPHPSDFQLGRHHIAFINSLHNPRRTLKEKTLIHICGQKIKDAYTKMLTIFFTMFPAEQTSHSSAHNDQINRLSPLRQWYCVRLFSSICFKCWGLWSGIGLRNPCSLNCCSRCTNNCQFLAKLRKSADDVFLVELGRTFWQPLALSSTVLTASEMVFKTWSCLHWYRP